MPGCVTAKARSGVVNRMPASLSVGRITASIILRPVEQGVNTRGGTGATQIPDVKPSRNRSPESLSFPQANVLIPCVEKIFLTILRIPHCPTARAYPWNRYSNGDRCSQCAGQFRGVPPPPIKNRGVKPLTHVDSTKDGKNRQKRTHFAEYRVILCPTASPIDRGEAEPASR